MSVALAGAKLEHEPHAGAEIQHVVPFFHEAVGRFAKKTDAWCDAPFETAAEPEERICAVLGLNAAGDLDVGREADASDFERVTRHEAGGRLPDVVHVAIREIAIQSHTEIPVEEISRCDTTAEAFAEYAAAIDVCTVDVELEFGFAEACFLRNNGFAVSDRSGDFVTCEG